jgi:hypothetical protein
MSSSPDPVQCHAMQIVAESTYDIAARYEHLSPLLCREQDGVIRRRPIVYKGVILHAVTWVDVHVSAMPDDWRWRVLSYEG